MYDVQQLITLLASSSSNNFFFNLIYHQHKQASEEEEKFLLDFVSAALINKFVKMKKILLAFNSDL